MHMDGPTGQSLHEHEQQDPGSTEHGQGNMPPADEPSAGVERQLAQFAFVREEREREVRLQFRDVPAGYIAGAFRASGASLITITAERAESQNLMANAEVAPVGVPAQPEGSRHNHPHHARRRLEPDAGAGHQRPGELTVHYFYALGDIVYTVSITASSGVVESVAEIYPVAALVESELQATLHVVFRKPL
jgi:hypothetical protein